MKYYLTLLFSILLVACILLGGCIGEGPTEPPVPTDPTAPTEKDYHDTQLEITELSLAELEKNADEFYFGWNPGSTMDIIQVIYVVDGQGWFEEYRTEPAHEEFLSGRTVKVLQAYANTFNSLNFETFDLRFRELENLGRIVDKGVFLEKYSSEYYLLGGYIVRYENGNYSFLVYDVVNAGKTMEAYAEDGNLESLMFDIYNDRGSEIVHKLRDQEIVE